MDGNSNMCHQCFPVAKTVFWDASEGMHPDIQPAAWGRWTFFSAKSCWGHTWSDGSSCHLLRKRDMSILVQWTSTKGAEHLSYEEMLRQMGLFTQRIESSRISSSLAKIPDEKMQRAWNQTFFSMMPSDRTEGNGPKRENGKFIFKARKTEVFHFVPELWSKQPYRAEECIASKTWLGRGSKHMIWVMIFLKSKWIYLGKVQVF